MDFSLKGHYTRRFLVRLLHMNGSGNQESRPSPALGAFGAGRVKKTIEHLLSRSNKVPTAVQASMRRVAESMKNDVEPHTDDLALCLLFLIEEDRKRAERIEAARTTMKAGSVLPPPRIPSSIPDLTPKPKAQTPADPKRKVRLPPPVNPNAKPASPFRGEVEAMIDNEKEKRTRRILGLGPNKKD
jgi:hypothetical protein